MLKKQLIESSQIFNIAKLLLPLCAVALLLLPLLFFAENLFVFPAKGEESIIAAPDSSPAIGGLSRTSYADLVDKVAPAVVMVRSERKVKQAGNAMMRFAGDPRLQEFFGGKIPQPEQRPQVERGLGSGVIVNADGTILTNAHVVEGADKIKVELTDKRTFEAKILGTDKLSDLAVLKIEAGDLPAMPIGNSDKVRVGDVVLAIGNPLGLQQTVTSGIISAKGRATGAGKGSFEDFLQTDAPINQGNSGGALINLNGELIGINSQILSNNGGGNIGIGFAIPTNLANNVMAQLVKDGKVRRGMLGIGVQNVTSELAANFGLKEIKGAIVNDIQKGSGAEKAGIKQGDVILSFNNAPVSDANELRNKVAETQPNTEVTLGIQRDEKTQDIKITLGELNLEKDSAQGETDDDNSAQSGKPSGKLGIEVAPLTPQTAQQFGIKGVTEGLIVADIDENGAAAEAGIETGDVILQVNRQIVKTPAEMQDILAKNGNNSILLLVNRKGQTVFLTVQPT